MCLILVAWQSHPEFPLVVAANRDEFHARPTAVAARWHEAPQVRGGRDLEAGGTWLGVADGGRFAAVTNVREPGQPPGEVSRGHLTHDFLTGTLAPAAYLGTLDGSRYAGFNLLVADDTTLAYRSNRDGVARTLSPGIYGVSNHLLDTPWPKLASAKARFAAALAASHADAPGVASLFAILADAEIVPDEHLPATGVSLEWERMLSAVFVLSPKYGTRASTVLFRRADGSGLIYERSFAADGRPAGEVELAFSSRR